VEESARDVIVLEDDDCDEDTEQEQKKWTLIACYNLTSPMWKYFKKFSLHVHPTYKDKAARDLCFAAKKYKRGTVATKGGQTTGLKKHMLTHHRQEYEDSLEIKGAPSLTASITSVFPVKPKEMYLGPSEMKRQFKVAAATWVIERNIPFQEFNEPTFRAMFSPLNKKAPEIVNVSNLGIKEKVYDFGRYAEKATHLEMKGQELCWTTDHWTGPNDETYSDLTAHFIDEEWNLKSILLDFKVFVGRTRGEDIYRDISTVLGKFSDDTTMVLDTIGITDTTGNMGKLGSYCRENGRRHAYCTDHVLHRNAILAFNRKLC
jgi:hypothetical protein